MDYTAKNLRYPSETTPVDEARESLLNYYDPGVTIDQVSQVLEVPVSRLNLINRRCAMALYVIFVNAMRSTEYLTATAADILGGDRLVIHGAKGSRSYIIQAPGIGAQFAPAEFPYPARFVSGTTYRQLWAACVKIGLGDIVRSRENHARTHAARYRLAASLCKEKLPTIADALRHRSQRSTTHYMA
jgi:integrase